VDQSREASSDWGFPCPRSDRGRAYARTVKKLSGSSAPRPFEGDHFLEAHSDAGTILGFSFGYLADMAGIFLLYVPEA
jgi:hypothetical protein